MTKTLKKFLTNIAGYALILLGIATGWIPGPGGIPLILAGLALLSLHNAWARRLREWLVKNGADFVLKFLPTSKRVQILYDVVAACILAIVAWLVWIKAPIWATAITAGLFLGMVAIIGMSRDKLTDFKQKYGGIDNDPSTPG